MTLPPRQRLCTMALCCVLALLAGPTGDLRAAPTGTRAMWVWGEADDALPGWARRHGIDTLLFEIPTSRLKAATTRALLSGARREGLDVWAMSGHAAWATDVAQTRRWVRAAARTPGIVGIVLDVEPYLLDSWSTDRPRTIAAYLRMLRVAKKAAGALPLMVAVPFWFDHDAYRRGSRTLTDRVADRVDALAVMAYRDRVDGSDGVVALARGEVEAATLRDKATMIALQTAPDELDKLTFFEEGERALEVAIADIERAFADAPGFAGVALHHYRAYRELRR